MNPCTWAPTRPTKQPTILQYQVSTNTTTTRVHLMGCDAHNILPITVSTLSFHTGRAIVPHVTTCQSQLLHKHKLLASGHTHHQHSLRDQPSFFWSLHPLGVSARVSQHRATLQQPSHHTRVIHCNASAPPSRCGLTAMQGGLPVA